MEDILSKLVAYQTVAGNGQAKHELLEYVAGFVTERGMHVTWHESNGLESIVATVVPDHKTPKVLLAAHADVVPGQDDDFRLRREDGKYVGRGVIDMKFAIAAYLQIIDDIKDDIAAYDIGLMITTDEELGGRDGVAVLVDKGYIPQVCILPDGGDNWQIQTASKGLWAFDITAEGKTAHGSRPWLGSNALTTLMQVLAEIQELFSPYPHPDTNTMVLSRLHGGMAMNQVPDSATMTLDIRTIDSAEHARIYDAVTRICMYHDVTYSCVSDGAPTSFDLADPLIAPFARLIEQETGVTVRGFHALGTSDVRFYVPFGVPCISVYPRGGNLHAEGEWLDVASLEQFRRVTLGYLQLIAHTGSTEPTAGRSAAATVPPTKPDHTLTATLS